MVEDPEEASLAHRVHSALEPLREQVVRVSRGFSRRVSDGIEELLQHPHKGPSVFTLLGNTLLEVINLFTRGAQRRRSDSEEER